MTRTDFPAAVALTVTKTTGFQVSAAHVESIALAMWDAATNEASTPEQFKSALIAGTACLTRSLAAMAA